MLFVCIFLLSSCTSVYHEHFFHENQLAQKGSIISGEFATLTGGEIWTLPDSSVRKNLEDAIKNAKHRIWIEIYLWTDAARLTDAILDAKSRSLDVRVLIEGSPYGTPKINNSIIQKLRAANIPVYFSDVHRYTFTHAKFWILDDTYYVSTGNWTDSFFAKNREYIYLGTDHPTLTILENIFIADTEHLAYTDVSRIPPYLVLSPIDARKKLTDFIQKTQKKLVLYIQTLDDPGLIDTIVQMQNRGISVEICTADNETNSLNQKKLQSILHWKMVKKPYLHAKIMIQDQQNIYIGSHNFTTNALDNNRELGVILSENQKNATKIYQDFISDGCK